MKIFNFAAGPSMIPEPVMKKVQKEFRNYNSMGIGVTELSHRTPEFIDIIEKTEFNIRDIMNISDDYDVCFVQGGASLQYAMIPMNLMLKNGFAEYADTGYWSQMAILEAEKFGKVDIIGSGKVDGYNRISKIRKWKPDSSSSYLHITTNNATYGTQFHSIPTLENGVPMIADMSADIMTRRIDVSQFGVIYATTQRVMGPTGVSIVIIRKDLVERSKGKNLATMLDYSTFVDENSMHNTPPTFSIYLLLQVTEWLKEQGGMDAVDRINTLKSEELYERIDASGFYTNFVVPADRSKVNVVFKLPTKELDAKFLKEAYEAGLIGLKGHRSVEGLRASIYNAMPLEGVEVLLDFMNDFERKNG